MLPNYEKKYNEMKEQKDTINNMNTRLNNVAPTVRLAGPNLNDLEGNYMNYCLNATNVPSGQERYGFLLQISIAEIPYKKQLWSSFDVDTWFKRTCNNGTWSSWTQL